MHSSRIRIVRCSGRRGVSARRVSTQVEYLSGGCVSARGVCPGAGVCPEGCLLYIADGNYSNAKKLDEKARLSIFLDGPPARKTSWVHFFNSLL